MRKNVIWFVLTIVTALFHTKWPEALVFQQALPDLVLLLVVYLAVTEGEERAMFTGLIGGVYQDVAGNAVLGHHVLCLVVAAYVVGRISTRLITDHAAVRAGLVFCAGLIHGLLFALVAYVQQPAAGVVYPILTSVIPCAFYTAFITPLALLLLSWAFQGREALQGGG